MQIFEPCIKIKCYIFRLVPLYTFELFQKQKVQVTPSTLSGKNSKTMEQIIDMYHTDSSNSTCA